EQVGNSASTIALSTFNARERELLKDRNVSLGHLEDHLKEYKRLGIRRPFALELEARMLRAYIEQDASRQDLKARLVVVEQKIHSKTPLLLYAREEGPAALDGTEASIASMVTSQERLDRILAAYRLYAARGRLQEFPKKLERDALLMVGEQNPDHY